MAVVEPRCTEDHEVDQRVDAEDDRGQPVKVVAERARSGLVVGEGSPPGDDRHGDTSPKNATTQELGLSGHVQDSYDQQADQRNRTTHDEQHEEDDVAAAREGVRDVAGGCQRPNAFQHL